MNKIFYSLLLGAAVGSANAATVSYSTGDGSLDIVPSMPQDQVSVLFSKDEDASAAGVIPLNIEVEAPITSYTVELTSTVNPHSGFGDDFTVTFSDGTTFGLGDFTENFDTGGYGASLGNLEAGSYNFTLAGSILKEETGLDIRVMGNPTSAEEGVTSPDTGAVPVPAAVWLFGSSLGLLGFIRRRKAA